MNTGTKINVVAILDHFLAPKESNSNIQGSQKVATCATLSERSQSQIRKKHNEIEFFGTKLCLHKDFANQKACIFIAVNFRHYQF